MDSTAYCVSMDDIDSSSCHVTDNNEDKRPLYPDMVTDTVGNSI